MNGEKQNSEGAKLRALETVPEGFHFSSARVWDRMALQLGKRRRKSVLWPAAACLILLFVSVFFLLKDKLIHSDASVTVKFEHSKPFPSKPQLIPPKTSLGAASTGHPDPVPGKKYPGKQNIDGKNINQAIIEESADTAVVVYAPEQLPADTQQVVVTVPVKRRFPIAHINELAPMAPAQRPEAKKPPTFVFRKSFTTSEEVQVTPGLNGFPKKRSLFNLNTSQ